MSRTDNETIDLEIQIDENSLDVEWVGQPRMYFKYASMLADAKREQDQAKVELDLVTAELDMVIRSDPDKFGIGKVTEAAIKATVLAQKEYGKAQKAVLTAKHGVDVLGAAVTALDHRKKALEGLVQLRLANYFSEPRAPEGAKERLGEASKENIRRRGRNRSGD